MRKIQDITNNRYGRLIALERVENDKYNHPQWLCQCDCGNKTVVLKSSLVSGRTRSCGCYHKDTRHTCATTHGQSKTRLFCVWAEMRGRCKNPNRKDWKYYGGKGVRVCDEWNKFENFSKWAYENGYTNDLTIDRIDVNGDYTPMNCRWADWVTQMNNTSRNHFISANGQTHTLAEWSRITGISLSTINWRIAHGWNAEDVVNLQKHIIRKVAKV